MSLFRMVKDRRGVRMAGAVVLSLARGAAVGAVAVAGVLAAAPAAAQGQVAAVEPYYVVTTGGDGVLRCGNLEIFYPVADLKAGQVLRVDGESENWKRVAYPAGSTVFVAAEDVQVSADGKTATLTRPSNLKAANGSRLGLKGSWKNVFDPTPLPVGTKLTVVKAEQTDDGKKQAYRVEAPEGARAFVHNGYVRRATDEEVTAAGFSSAAVGQAPVAPKVDAVKPDPAGHPATPNSQPAPGGTDLTAPQVPPGEGSRPVPPADLAHGTGEAGQPASDNPAPGERALATPEQLNAAFEEVRKQPTITAELDELIAEYQRTIDARSAPGSDKRIAASLTQRMEMLKLRKDVQAQLVAIQEAKAATGDAGRAAAEEIAKVNQTRHYEVIGRLTTSTVYDGKKLPLMYRVQSVGDAVARTLGYLRPDDKLELEKKIGQIVGVAGEPDMDKSLKLNVLTASRVDVLSPSPEKQEASAPDNH